VPRHEGRFPEILDRTPTTAASASRQPEIHPITEKEVNTIQHLFHDLPLGLLAGLVAPLSTEMAVSDLADAHGYLYFVLVNPNRQGPDRRVVGRRDRNRIGRLATLKSGGEYLSDNANSSLLRIMLGSFIFLPLPRPFQFEISGPWPPPQLRLDERLQQIGIPVRVHPHAPFSLHHPSPGKGGAEAGRAIDH
jgi:hypothetical protein